MTRPKDWSGGFNIVSGGYAVCRTCEQKLDRVEGRCTSCGAALSVATVRIVRGRPRAKAGALLRRIRYLVAGRGELSI
jgi:predicted amidophosphoribosyltransferase